MKRIRIKSEPSWVTAVIIGVLVIWVIYSLFVLGGVVGIGGLYAWVAIFVVIIILSIIVDTTETEVEYGVGSKISCKWLFYSWVIDMESISSVNYTVTSHRARMGAWYTLDLIFRYKNNDDEGEMLLKTKINSEDIVKGFENNAEEIPLMGLYKYIEEEYREKAMGYEKHEETEWI